MPAVRSSLTAVLALGLVLSSGESAAKRKPAPAGLEGLERVQRIVPKSGFIADAMAFDGNLLAYVETDSATMANLRVFDTLLQQGVSTEIGGRGNGIEDVLQPHWQHDLIDERLDRLQFDMP